MDMRRFFLYKVIPSLVLLLFILLMNSGNYLKKPLGLTDNVPKILDQIQRDLEHQEWSIAHVHIRTVESAWKEVVHRIQFSEERDEINNFQHSLARLKGFVKAHHKAGSMAELEELKETWDNLGR